MRTKITLNTFRKLERSEETMMRAMMPTTSARSTEALNSYGFERTTRRSERTLTLPKGLTFKMTEVR
jgi:hypothetical protein